MFRKILVATDLSTAAEPALSAGAALAAKCEAALLVLHLETRMHLHAPERDPEIRLKDEIRKCIYPQYPAVSVSSEIVTGIPPGFEILNYARSQGCDVVVVGRHGHTMRHLFLGSVVQELIRNTEIPVMVVPPIPIVQGLSCRKILLPTDFSQPSMKALEWGIRLGRFLGAQLDFVHVLDLPGLEEMHTTYLMEQLKFTPMSFSNVQVLMERVLRLYEWEGLHRIVKLEGDPPVELLKYAKQNHSDLIVMGTHGRKTLERVLVGSVTAAVISRSDIPVFTIARHSSGLAVGGAQQ